MQFKVGDLVVLKSDYEERFQMNIQELKTTDKGTFAVCSYILLGVVLTSDINTLCLSKVS